MEGRMRFTCQSPAVITVVFLSLMPGPAAAQTCLHDNRSESQAERQRRTDALMAVRLISSAESDVRRPKALVPLADLGPSLAHARSDSGPIGRVARALDLDSREILPGWSAEFVV